MNFSSIYKELMRVFALSLTLFTIIIYVLRKKYNKFILIFFLYLIFGLISCYLGTYSSINNFISAYSSIIGIVLLTDIAINYDSKSTLKIIEIILFILILINTITIIIYPNGLYVSELYTTNWFLLYDNMHIFVFMPALLVSFLINKYNKKKYSLITILLLIMITYSVIYCFSANTVIAYTLFILYILFEEKLSKIKIFNSYTYFISYFILFFSMVVFRIQNALTGSILNFFEKDITFSGRTKLWDRIIRYIKQKPIIGYGIEHNKTFTSKMGSQYFTHAHNTIYDVLYKGGIVSLTLFIYLIYIVIKELHKFKDGKVAKLIGFTLLCYFIMMTFEARQEKFGLWLVLELGFNVNLLINDMKVKQNESN